MKGLKRKLAMLLCFSMVFTMCMTFAPSKVSAADSNGNTVASRLGVNIEGLSDWSGANMFVDLMKTSRAWGLAGQPWVTGVKTDANGWPTEDAGVIVFCDQVDVDMGGTYKLSFDGSATIVTYEGIKIQNQVYSGGKTTADIVIPKNASQLFLTFNDTNKGVKNVKIIRPGYSEDQTFTDVFLKALDPFTTIRYMDFLNTNGQNSSDSAYYDATTIDWSDRKLPTDASQASSIGKKVGGAWEYVIELANLTHKDIWINVPYNVTNNYLTSLAQLLKAKLDSDINIYVEYSNEVWNWQFAQAQLNAYHSQSDPVANNYIKQYAKKVAETAVAFRNVYGSAAMNNKVRVVLAWQFGWSPADSQPREQLNYIRDNFEEPANLIYSYATAPYFSEPLPEDCTSISAIHEFMTKSSDKSVADKIKLVKMCNEFGLVGGMTAYEGGPHHQGQVDVNLSTRLAAHRDPAMKDVLLNELKKNWFDVGGGLFCYFGLTGRYGVYGCWGLAENISNLNTPKYNAILELQKMTDILPMPDLDAYLPPVTGPQGELLKNGDFSSGLNEWGYEKDALVSLSDNLGVNSSKCAKLVRNNTTSPYFDRIAQNSTELKANTEYTVTFKYKGGDAQLELAGNKLSMDNNTNKSSEFYANSGSEWNTATATFITKNESGTVDVRIMPGNTIGASVYIDNVSLTEKDPVLFTNGDFERGMESWGQETYSLNTIVNNQGVNNSKCASLVRDSASGSYFDRIAQNAENLKANTEYTISLKYRDNPVTIEISGDRASVDGNPVKSSETFSYSGTGWKTATVTLKTNANNPGTVGVRIMPAGEKGSVTYVDNVTVERILK